MSRARHESYLARGNSGLNSVRRVLLEMMMITIKRQAAPELRGYAKNGNVDTQAMTYRWLVFNNGKLVGSYTRLKDAKSLALDFGFTNPVISR